ncbi:MAG: DUF2892 domain-containing protein [Bacteroidales bacterium]|nr:DUF2892 domain-containing protein [Bacteroidales bacterium]
MKKNIGSTDQIFRWIVGIVIAGLGIYYQSWWGLVAIIPIGTALLSFCPLYTPFNISTRKKG